MKFPLYLACAVGVLAFDWPWGDDDSTTSTGVSLQSAIATTANLSLVSATNYDDGQAYVPKETECPSFDIVRNASGLYQSEKEYIQKRHEVTNENLVDFLDNVAQLTNFDAASFINKTKDTHNITIGLAFSGGGYRAMLCGAGEILALDNRYSDLVLKGLGGLLQSSTYLTGLSGGSWLLGTLVLNDWISVADILEENSGIWNLEDLIFNPSGINVLDTVEYYTGLGQALVAKSDAGFDVSITDVWGRALSYQFYNPDKVYNGGENLTWSGIQGMASFQNYLMPFPIVVADGRSPGTLIINENSTVFEITPYELGSWDPSIESFVDLRYLGTDLVDGHTNSTKCVTNFDNAGYVLGTLSSLFNQILLTVDSSSLNWAVKKVLETVLLPFLTNNVDIATYLPNPFFGTSYGTLDSISSNETLNLVDGGEDSQNVPLYPLIQSSRGVDVIFAYDNSADVNHWPNGTSLVHTFERQFATQGKGTPFPFVPSVEEFVSEQLNERPVFFGCDAQNLTDLVKYHNSGYNVTDVPLVIYMPNLQYSYEANVSTYQMSYDTDEKLQVIENGFAVSSRGNYTDDRKWPTCVGCAIIRRQQERLGEEQSDECKSCFADYCWVGGIKDTPQLSIGPLNTDSLSGSTTGSTGTTLVSATSKSGSTATSSSEQSSTNSSRSKGDANYRSPPTALTILLALFALY